MFGFEGLELKPTEVLEHLDQFESFCRGETVISPEKFKSLNIDLSISAVMHIGRKHFRDFSDGKHLIWISPDAKEHDLGTLTNINVFRDYPGFNRSCSLSLAQDKVVHYEVMEVNGMNNITRVELTDGSIGIAPNYRMALRNAALRMHLKKSFNKSSLANFFKMIAAPNRNTLNSFFYF